MAYNAFISYSHTADSTVAASLQSGLHSFAKPWYKLRALHIFRDQTNLAVNPALWSSIRDALDQASFFILLASPDAASSPWVAKEAEYWISKNGTSRVLIVLTDGALNWDRTSGCFTPESTTALPASLLRSFPEEPLFLDLRWARSGTYPLRLREPHFHEAVLQLAATLHNRPKDELDSADIRNLRHTRWLAASGLIAILLASLFGFRQTQVSHNESQQNLAASLAANSAKLLTDSHDRASEAALLAIESVRINPTFEGNRALRAAVSILPADEKSYLPESSDPAERVRDMAASRDGATLAIGRDNGSAQLIDVVNKKPIGYLTPDEEPAANIEVQGASDSAPSDNNAAVSVAFNPTGSLVAVGARDGVAHVWALPGGRELLRISHGEPLSQVSFSPKANQLATAGDDGHVRIFDTDQAEMVADFKCPDKIVATSFSPGGELIAALSSEGVISLFDPVHRKLVRRFGGGEAGFNLEFDQLGKRLAVASGDFASVWDVTTGRQLLNATHAAASEPLTPQQWIVNAAISPNGRLLAYAARGDSLARVWSVDTGREILELKHDSAVAAVSFDADGTKLGTGSYDGTARVWEVPSGVELQSVPIAGGAEIVTFLAGGRFAAGGMGGSVSVSKPRRADRPGSFDAPDDVRSAAFSPDGRRFAFGTTSVQHEPLVRVGEVGSNTVHDIEFHGAPVIDKLFFVDSNNVIAQWSNKLFLIAIDQSKVTSPPDVPGDIRVEPSGKVLVSQQESVSRLYTLPDLRQTMSLEVPSSRLLRSAGEGSLLAFETSRPPNESLIDVWNVGSKARVSRIAMTAELTKLAFNPPGTILFTAQSENLQAWDIPSGKRRFAITTSGDIDLILPDPASAYFATITHGHLTVWDAVTGARLAELPDNMGYLRTAAFSPDGRYLLAGYDEHSAALWLWRSSDLRDQACARLTYNLSHDEWKRWFPKEPYRQICPNLPPAN
jgi:WD40 repeat protein